MARFNWTAVTSPADDPGFANGGAYSPTLGLIAVGCGEAYTTTGWDTVGIMTSTDGGVTWTSQGNPVNSLVHGGVTRIVWSPALAMFVGTAETEDASLGWVSSTDGVTWTANANLFPQSIGASAIAWSPDLGQFLMGGGTNSTIFGGSPGPIIATSTDGVTWTYQTTPWDSDNPSTADAAVWDHAGSCWIVVGSRNASFAKKVLTSPDGVTWTEQTTPLDGNSSFSLDIAAIPEHSDYVISTQLPTYSLMYTPDHGVTWIVVNDGMDYGTAIVDFNGLTVVGGDGPPTVVSANAGISGWVDELYLSDYGVRGLISIPSLNRVIACGNATGSPDTNAIWIGIPIPPPTPVMANTINLT